MMGTDVTMVRYIIGNVSSAVCFGTARCYISASSWRPRKKKERPTIQLGHIFHLASRSPCPEFPSSTWVNGDWRAILRRRLVDSRKIDSGRIREIWWEKQPSWKVGGEKKRQLIRDTKEKRRLARIITETRMCNPFPQPAAHRSGASKVSAL